MKNDLTNMMSLDIYASNLDKEQYTKITAEFEPSSRKGVNLISWGIQDLFMGDGVAEDLKTIKVFTTNFNWKANLSKIIQENYYESLVLTNTDKKILWVSNGFTKMTGYDKEYALDKTPRFLQGKDTQEATRERIRRKLRKGIPFKEVIINYRKDTSSYKCALHIIPLYNANSSKITHFLALEKEVV